MSRLLKLTLAATAALGFAAPAFAQAPAPATTDAMPSTDLPWCSTAVTDHCRQHEGRGGMMMHHHSMMRHHHHKHHHMMKHHGSMKKM